jgi:small-conductance mechanosensitive channel
MEILSIDVWRNVVTNALSTLWEKLASFAPNLIGAIIILFIGYIISKFLSKICRALLTKIGFDKACDRIGVHSALTSTGIEIKGSALISGVIFWLIMLMFMISVSETLGLDKVALTVESFVLYLPNVIAAALIFVIGSVIASFTKDLVSNGADRLGMEYAKPLSSFVYGVLIVVISLLAIEQLQFDTNLISNAIQILLVAAGLALALTLGLGTRQISQQLVSGVYAREMFSNGDRIRIEDSEGVIEEIGSVSSRIVLDNSQKLQIPNDILVESLVTKLS